MTIPETSHSLSRRKAVKGVVTWMTAFLLTPVSVSAASKGSQSTARIRTSTPSQRSNTTARSMILHSKANRGHLTTRHIGRTNNYLKARASAPALNYDFARAAGGVSAKRLKGMKPKRRKEFSTFKDEKAAQAALARAIDMNRGSLRDMMKAGHTRRTISVPVGRDSGVVYKTGTKRFVQPKRAVFSVQRIGRRLVLKTGYLTSQGSKA